MDPMRVLHAVHSLQALQAHAASLRMASSSSEDECRKTKPGSSSRKRNRGDSEKQTPPLRTLKQYMIEEKLDIINFAKQSGNRAAGREYNVAESSIREWRKNEERLRATLQTEPNRNRLVGGGRKPKKDEDQTKELMLRTSTPDEHTETLNSSGVSMSNSTSCTTSASTSPSSPELEKGPKMQKSPDPQSVEQSQLSVHPFGTLIIHQMQQAAASLILRSSAAQENVAGPSVKAPASGSRKRKLTTPCRIVHASTDESVNIDVEEHDVKENSEEIDAEKLEPEDLSIRASADPQAQNVPEHFVS